MSKNLYGDSFIDGGDVLRFHDDERRLELGVHDLLSAGPQRGDLRMQVAWARLHLAAPSPLLSLAGIPQTPLCSHLLEGWLV